MTAVTWNSFTPSVLPCEPAFRRWKKRCTGMHGPAWTGMGESAGISDECLYC